MHARRSHGDQRIAHRRHRRDPQFGPGPHDRGSRSQHGRSFAYGDPRLPVLHFVAERPRHSYEMLKAIEEQAGGACSPGLGVNYQTLALPEELGYVTVSIGDGANKPHLAWTKQAVCTAAVPHDRSYALETLKLVLRLRLAQGHSARIRSTPWLPCPTAQLAALNGPDVPQT
jgi:hypothetical protein